MGNNRFRFLMPATLVLALTMAGARSQPQTNSRGAEPRQSVPGPSAGPTFRPTDLYSLKSVGLHAPGKQGSSPASLSSPSAIWNCRAGSGHRAT
jgi:hypothetical protein